MTGGVDDPGTVVEMVNRAARADYERWAEQVERCGRCARPVRLRGRIIRRGREVYSTDAEPDGVLFVRCRNRRASVCPSCSYEYAGDMWQLLYAGAAGRRKDVPESIRSHPLVFVTLTAPGFGPVHTTRADRHGKHGRCRPWGEGKLCLHRRPTWCAAIHGEDDERLGTPLCDDCYDYAGHVAFNWYAPELWRRFTITLRRVLARQLGLGVGELARSARLSFVKVAEFQRRGVVHFHALIRLDGPTEFTAPALTLGVRALAEAVQVASRSVRLVIASDSRGGVPPALVGGDSDRNPRQPDDDEHSQALSPSVAAVNDHPHGEDQEHQDWQRSDHSQQNDQPAPVARRRIPRVVGHEPILLPCGTSVLRFGEQVDVQVIGAGAGGELTPERVAAYLAKYATKSAEDFGLGERRLSGLALSGVGVSAHVARIVRTAWDLGAVDELAGLRRWLHMLGFRGHFATKSRATRPPSAPSAASAPTP